MCLYYNVLCFKVTVLIQHVLTTDRALTENVCVLMAGLGYPAGKFVIQTEIIIFFVA